MIRSRHALRSMFGLLVAVGAILAGAGCGIEADSGPRDIPEELVASDIQVSDDEAVGTSRVYLLAPSDPDEPPRLRSVLRDVANDPDPLLRSLFSGPNTDEQEAQLGTALPREIELLSAPRTVGSVLTVDVTDVFGELTTGALRLAIGQIVVTGAEIDGVDSVRVRVDGITQIWPVGDGELTQLPLTVYDYPGLVESTQPPLPAIPSVESA